jgi:hypothetical protein
MRCKRGCVVWTRRGSDTALGPGQEVTLEVIVGSLRRRAACGARAQWVENLEGIKAHPPEGRSQEILVAKSGQPANHDTPQPLGLPVYGNYCGVGHGDATYKTPPIDAVDLVCQEHDRCYRLLGVFPL